MELFLVVGLMSAGLVAFLYGRSDARRTRRVLRRTRVTRIADLVDGKLACVVGKVEAEGDLLEALISRKKCVAYDTTIQMFSGRDFTYPAHVDVQRKVVPFFVNDGTGRVRVDAPTAALCNRPIARNERFEERVIEPGATVRLVGSVALEPVLDRAEHGFRDGGVTARITGTAKYPLLVDVEADP